MPQHCRRPNDFPSLYWNFCETLCLSVFFKLTRRGNLQWNDSFWWMLLDLLRFPWPAIKFETNSPINNTLDVVLMCTILVSSLMISSALPGQYLCFCRNEFIVLMEYATSENGQRGNLWRKFGSKLKLFGGCRVSDFGEEPVFNYVTYVTVWPERKLNVNLHQL